MVFAYIFFVSHSSSYDPTAKPPEPAQIASNLAIWFGLWPYLTAVFYRLLFVKRKSNKPWRIVYGKRVKLLLHPVRMRVGFALVAAFALAMVTLAALAPVHFHFRVVFAAQASACAFFLWPRRPDTTSPDLHVLGVSVDDRQSIQEAFADAGFHSFIFDTAQTIRCQSQDGEIKGSFAVIKLGNSSYVRGGYPELASPVLQLWSTRAPTLALARRLQRGVAVSETRFARSGKPLPQVATRWTPTDDLSNSFLAAGAVCFGVFLLASALFFSPAPG